MARFNRNGLFLLTLFIGLVSCKTVKTDKEPQDGGIGVLDEIKHDPSPLPYQSFGTQYFDLIHTKLNVTPQWHRHQLEGVATLTLAPHAYNQDTLVLDAKDFLVHDVVMVNQKDDSIAPLRYTYNKKQIKIRQESGAWKMGDTFRIKIAYTARPEDLMKDSIIPNLDEQGLYFVNPDGVDSGIPRELWSQGETEHNSCWFPTIDHPDQKMTQEIAITVDTGMTTLSNGSLDFVTLNGDGTKTDHWSLEKPNSVYLAMIAAGKFAEIRDKWRDSIPVNYYVEPQYAPYARLVFGHTPAMIEYFSQLLRYDFPWPKYSQVVVRNFTSGAMENTSAVTMYDAMQHDARANLDETDEDIISHELFHHWFGDLVTCKSWANLALNESFAQFAETLWEEHEYGKDEADLMFLTDLNSYLSSSAPDRGPIIEHYYRDPEDLFDKIRYEKGALVLNMLRHYIGNDVFFEALHNYLMANEYGCVEIADLQKAMEQASGQDLNWFFGEWFLKTGYPVLKISQKYDTAHHKLQVWVQQFQQIENKDIPIYKMQTEIDVEMPNGKTDKHIVWLQHETDSFAFDVAVPPMNVDFDPEKILLCEKKETKPRAQWYWQFFHSVGFRDKCEAMQAMSNQTVSLLGDSSIAFWKTAIHDPFWYIRKKALDDLGYSAGENRLLAEIKDMALSDKNSEVRVSALDQLQHLVNIDTIASGPAPINDQVLGDSSYEVVATALRNIILESPAADSLHLMKTVSALENCRSLDVLYEIAEVYGRYGTPANASFFRRMSTQLTYGYLSAFCREYDAYLSRMDANTIARNEQFILTLKDWDLSYSKATIHGFYKGLAYTLSKRNDAKAKQLSEDFEKAAKGLEKAGAQ